ncbi:MAG: EAL domain-containing protein [Pseudolabrys sp.]|nr:EAL domain-containing protein [Pseudolabrys sp.]
MLFGISFVVAIAASTAILIFHLRDRDLANSERELSNTVLVLAEHTDKAFKSLELVQSAVVERIQSLGITSSEELERNMSGQDAHLRFKQQISGLKHVDAIGLINADGELVGDSRSWPIRHFNVADREYFRAFKSNPDLTSFVGEPMHNRESGAWTITLARKISGPNGEFLGLVVGLIKMQYFEETFGAITLDSDSSISLFRRDGTLLARYPRVDSLIGRSFGPHVLFATLLEHSDHGAGRQKGVIDGEDRLIAAHAAAHYPIVIAATTTVRAALAGWKQIAEILVGLGFFGMLAAGTIILLIARQLMLRNNWSRQRLQLQKSQLDMAINNISQGLAMFDSSTRLIVCNQRYLEMYRLSPEIARPGCTLLELLNHRVATGTFFTDDPEQYISSLIAAIKMNNIIPKTLSMRDGRIITVINRPTPNGGWVATHEDVTDKVNGEKEKENQKRQNEIALSSMLQGLCMFDAEQRLIVCNKRFIDLYGLSDEHTRPGTPLRSILQYRASVGSVPEDHEHYFKKRLSQISIGQPYYVTTRLQDGRYISVVTKPLADGGWVATHEDVTEIRRSEDRIAHMAYHDALTGLPNREQFRKQLVQALERVGRGENFAVHYLDLDNFKTVNDTLGHLVGDELLKVVADRLKGCIRGTDTLARLGGDEFAIIQAAIEQPSDAARLAMRIGEAIKGSYDITGHQLVMGASIGISIAPRDGGEPEQLLKNADLAMYGAKADRGDTYRFFEPEMEQRIKARIALEFEMRQAIVRNEFELYYQPLVNLRDGKITGCEALLRWHHPQRGLVSPAEFIPIAEETGLINQLGEWALKTACAEAATWPDDIKIAVNVSPVQFKDQSLELTVVGALAASGLPASRLELEITESVLIRDHDAALVKLSQLRELGVKIALDDFGTGYSSLSYLQHIPFDKIKIDRCFIKNISNEDGSTAIVQAVVNIAQSRNIVTVAEGVETEQQKELLRTLGCTEMQGYLFSRPQPAAEIHQLFLEIRIDAERAA